MPRSTNVRVRLAPHRRHTWSGDIPPSSLLPAGRRTRGHCTASAAVPAEPATAPGTHKRRRPSAAQAVRHRVPGRICGFWRGWPRGGRDGGACLPGMPRAGPATWCSTWASSQPATISRGATTRARIRSTRCRCGCAALRPGPAGDRPDSAGGAEGRRAGRARSPGRRRRGAGRRGRAAGERRPGRRVRQPARWLLAGVARSARAHAGARRRSGRCDRRLLRHDARRGPVCGAGRAGGAVGRGRGAAAAVPLAGHDRRLRPVERAAARALRVLLDDRSGRHAGRAWPEPAHGVAFRALRRHRAAGRQPGYRRAGLAGRAGGLAPRGRCPRRCP